MKGVEREREVKGVEREREVKGFEREREVKGFARERCCTSGAVSRVGVAVLQLCRPVWHQWGWGGVLGVGQGVA